MRDVLKYTNFGQIRVGNLCLQPPPPSLPIITMFIILGLYHLPDRYNVIIIKDFFLGVFLYADLYLSLPLIRIKML